METNEVEGHYEGEVLTQEWDYEKHEPGKVRKYPEGGFIYFFAIVPIGDPAPALPSEKQLVEFNADWWKITLSKDSPWKDVFPNLHDFDINKHDLVKMAGHITRTETRYAGPDTIRYYEWQIQWEYQGRTERPKERRMLFVCSEFRKDMEDIPDPSVIGYDYENDILHLESGTPWYRFDYNYISRMRNPDIGVYVSVSVTDANGFLGEWASPVPVKEFWRGLHEDGKLQPRPQTSGKDICQPA